MTDSYYSALSAAIAQQKAFETVTHNLSNVNTIGYKQSMVAFSTVMAGVQDTSVHTAAYRQTFDLSGGALQKTNNPLDFALQGPGFFVVQDGGEQFLTRGGQFYRDPTTGILKNRDHLPVVGVKGPIVLPATAQVQVDHMGGIRVDGTLWNHFLFKAPKDKQTLLPRRNGLFSANELIDVRKTTRIEQGMLEGSNVAPVGLLTQIIGLQRAYENYHRTFETINAMERRLVDEIV